jgi:geranylgeranyl reductase family protein
MPELIKSDITIIGAGPAGITAAIALAKKGIPSLLIDKHQFPRQKICGDGLSGKVVSTLARLNPEYISELNASAFATGSWAAGFYSPNLKMIELSFQTANPSIPPGFICQRSDFDLFMLNKSRAFDEIKFISGTRVDAIIKENGWIHLKDSSGFTVAETRHVLFAAGANRKLIRQLNPAYPDSAEEGIGVRGYFENVTGSDRKHAIEIHFLKELLPWYLWIFPFSDGSANVGLALPGSLARKSKMNLKDLLFHLIQSYPYLKKRFKEASLKGKIEANRLAYYNGPCQVAGDQYMLLGDAARLIDPFTGEGIGNAMASGIYAAEIATKCFQSNNFSSDVTKEYQQLIETKLVPELALGLKLQSLARRQNLLNLVIGRASRNEKIKRLISDMLYNQDEKVKLSKPEFYIKILLGI